MAMRLKRLIEKFLTWCESARKPATTASYRYLLFKFLRSVGNLPIDKLKPLHLSMYAKTWHQVQSVQRLFTWAKDDLECLDRNVFSKVPRPPAGQRTRILSPRELAAFLRLTQLCFRMFLTAMRETIARPQEIRGLHWEMLQAENPRESLEEALAGGRAIFVLRDYKARDRRLDPSAPRVLLVNRRLGRMLLRLRVRAQSLEGPVFLNSLGRPWTGNAVRCRMRRLRKRMHKTTDTVQENIVAYSIRHSLATVAAAAGVRDRILADIMGHTSTRTTARYQHLQVEHLRSAMNAIDETKAKRRAEKLEEAKERKRKAA